MWIILQRPGDHRVDATSGVRADAHSIVIIAQIHEINGQRDDLKKFKCHIDQVSIYLLSLHFTFNNIDGAAGLVLDMCRCWDSLSIQKDRNDSHRTCLVPIGSYHLREGLKIRIVPELLQKDSVFKMDIKQELLLFSNGKYVLSNKALVKLIIAYEGGGRIGELSRLMVSLQKELGTLEGGGLISDVIDACIQLGWLETAHDILDDMELARAPIGSSTYISLLTAYYKGKMAGLAVDLSDEMVMTTCLSGVVDKNRMHTRTSTSIGNSGLAESLVREMKSRRKQFFLWFMSGYFERVMEVIGQMKEQNIYLDKWMYKSEFLKFHKNLYRNVKASNTRTEAQSKRLEYVEAFRKWAGID
ncbi:hypothetical protein AAG906_016670 [Vitis piasezkii]